MGEYKPISVSVYIYTHVSQSKSTSTYKILPWALIFIDMLPSFWGSVAHPEYPQRPLAWKVIEHGLMSSFKLAWIGGMANFPMISPWFPHDFPHDFPITSYNDGLPPSTATTVGSRNRRHGWRTETQGTHENWKIHECCYYYDMIILFSSCSCTWYSYYLIAHDMIFSSAMLLIC